MAFEIKNYSPITVFLDTDSASLGQMRSLLPDAIEIVGKYLTFLSEAPVYLYRVLMPYKFNAPSDTSIFGNKTDTLLKGYGDATATPLQGSTVLAQDVVYIHAYEK